MRAFGLDGATDEAGKDVRDAFRRVCGVMAGARCLLGAEGLLVVIVVVPLVERDEVTPPSFATEAAVGAVSEAGRRTGRVGDLGYAFVGGEAGPDFMLELVCVGAKAWLDVVDAAVGGLDTAGGRLDLGPDPCFD